MLAKDFTLNTYCNYVNCLVSGLAWFLTHIILVEIDISFVNIDQNWMFMLQAVVSVHDIVVKGSNMPILL